MYESVFPNINTSGSYKLTSDETPFYNCIAWAAGDNSRWWWPNNIYYWPPNIERIVTLDAFILCFQTLGYQVCDNQRLEESFEKIAIYTDSNGSPTHAARQLLSGKWTSKIGAKHDIEHELNGLEGACYGQVARIMKRKNS